MIYSIKEARKDDLNVGPALIEASVGKEDDVPETVTLVISVQEELSSAISVLPGNARLSSVWGRSQKLREFPHAGVLPSRASREYSFNIRFNIRK